jgi:hypothetical protein
MMVGMLSTLKHPSAWVPMLLSAAALSLVLGAVAAYGLPDLKAPQDEGALAHTWQLLMVAQAVGIMFFAVKWLPRTPGPAAGVLGLQILAAIAAAAPVFLLGL